MNELIRIIHGALRLDTEKVRSYTAFLAEKLEEAGESPVAHRLRRLLEESGHELRPTRAVFTPTVPVDEESRFPLLERVDVNALREPRMLIPESQQGTVREFVSIAKSYGQLEAAGLDPAVSLLLHGPPGCGKSRLARHVAQELGLDLYIARLDGLISSFLGSTSKNIRALFEFAARTPCALFLDEFDAIAKLRGDTQELGELKRVVNSFLQNLDTLGAQTVVIAATNHETLLDAAVWRRFSYRLELGYPNSELRRRMWLEFLHPTKFSAKSIALLTDLSEGFSGSDIREVGLRLHRRRLTQNIEPSIKDAFDGLRAVSGGEGQRHRFVADFRSVEPAQIAAELRARCPTLYSHAYLGHLLGVSKATAYRWTKE